MIDNFGRIFDYIRISLTDRCNLKCFYCVPKGFEELNRGDILTFEEIDYLVNLFWRLGIKKVRFTGGEPLMRKGIENLISSIRRKNGEIKISITTNGIFLKEKVRFLKECDVSLNVSLDTLDRTKFFLITKIDALNRVLEGIYSALNFGLNLKINTVLMRGINENEIFSLLDFAKRLGVEIRFIELMPFFPDWKEFFISSEDILKKLGDVKFLGRDGTSKLYLVDGVKVGFISTISDPFCKTCSRMRLTADGRIVLCMFDNKGYSIKEFLRPEIKEIELMEYISKIIKFKPKGYIEIKERGMWRDNIETFPMRRLGG